MQNRYVDAAANALPQRRILLVEDEVLVRLDLADSLRRAGFLVVEAGTVMDALAAMRQTSFDLVITDVHLPGDLSGLDLARQVKGEAPQLTVVVMSGLHRPTEEDLQIVDAFLPKPVADIATALQSVVDSKPS